MKTESVLDGIVTILREKAHRKYIVNKLNYKKLTEVACLADKRYLVSEFGEEQREVVDTMMEKQSEACDYELNCTYMAGAIGGIIVLQKLEILDIADKIA